MNGTGTNDTGIISGPEALNLIIDINEGVKMWRQTPGAVLIDSRGEGEYKSGHIPGSINIPLERIDTTPSIIPDKDTSVFIYGQRGQRSFIEVNRLRSLGYTRVYNLSGITDYKGELVDGSVPASTRVYISRKKQL